MAAVEPKLPTAEELLKALVDLHALEQVLGKKGADVPYDEMRKMRRDSEVTWRQARELVYGPEQADNKPKSAAEAKRWKANEQRVSVRRVSVRRSASQE